MLTTFYLYYETLNGNFTSYDATYNNGLQSTTVNTVAPVITYANIKANAFNGSSLNVTGAATLSNTLAVTGATTLNNTLAVTGDANLQALTVKDTFMTVGDGNTGDSSNEGLAFAYKNGGNKKFAGVKRPANTSDFVFFTDSVSKDAEPVTSINTTVVGPASTGPAFKVVFSAPFVLKSYKFGINTGYASAALGSSGFAKDMYIYGTNTGDNNVNLVYTQSSNQINNVVVTNSTVAYSTYYFVIKSLYTTILPNAGRLALGYVDLLDNTDTKQIPTSATLMGFKDGASPFGPPNNVAWSLLETFTVERIDMLTTFYLEYETLNGFYTSYDATYNNGLKLATFNTVTSAITYANIKANAFNGSSLNVTGATTVGGAATLSNTLAVTGAAALNSTLVVAGAATLNTLGVTGAATLNNTLAVTGAATLNTLGVTGAATLSNTLGVTGAATLSNTLAVTGAATLSNTLAVTGNASFSKDVSIDGNLAVKDPAILIADGNVTDLKQTGMQLQYKPAGASAVKYAGMKRIPVSGDLVFFKDSDTMIDGQVLTTASVSGAWVEWNVPSAEPIKRYSQAQVYSSPDRAIHWKSWTMIGSNDGINWTKIDSQVDYLRSNSTGLNSTPQNVANQDFFTIANPIGYSSIRFIIQKISGDLGPSGVTLGLSEMILKNQADQYISAGFSGVHGGLKGLWMGGLTSLPSVTTDSYGIHNIFGFYPPDSADMVNFAGTDRSYTGPVTTTIVLSSSAPTAPDVYASIKAGDIGSSGALTVAGAATFSNNVTVNGNLTVLGTQTTIDTTSLQVKDAAILIADGNTTDSIALGMEFQYKPTGSADVKYAGLKRRPGTGEFVLFKDNVTQIEQQNNLTSTQVVSVTGPVTIQGEWVTYDVGSAKKVAKYGITPKVDNDLLKWSIVGSNDKTSWNVVDRQEQLLLGSNSNVSKHTIVNPVAYRYYRVIFEKLKAYHATYTTFYIFMKDENDAFISNIDLPMGELVSAGFGGPNGYQAPYETKLSTNGEGVAGDFGHGGYQDAWAGQYGVSIYLRNGVVGYDVSTGEYSGSTTMNPIKPADLTIGPIDSYAMLLADSFNCASDMKLKKNVVTIENALDKLDGMRGVYHDWNDENNKEHSIGVIAQEVQAVYPELVHEGSDGYLSVNYPKLTAVLLQAIKELKALVLAK